MRESELIFAARLPRLEREKCLLVYDRKLRSRWGSWIREFPVSYAVSSGEGLKDLNAFPGHVEVLLRRTAQLSPKELTVLAFGGGSVGDFAGFFASVFKRGVRFKQIPSTWLAALDSAHGGKTALNVGSFKNQIGSFYPADTVYLVREVLEALGPQRFREAWPEAVKVAILQGPPLSQRLRRVRTARGLWRELPALIEAKMRIVRRDPLESKGLRHLLNLGHTVGHVIEGSLQVPHGLAVGLGTRFALQWSRDRWGFDLRAVESWGLPAEADLRKALRRLKDPRTSLVQDKKRSVHGKVRFIFMQELGRPRIEDVTVDEILAEIERQSR